jgi:ribonucleoside-diphosphate reductase alpha chain
MAFNSPVWFNVGVEANPQCSACFINSVEDTMESILTLAKTEGMLFKYGSGTGTNLSTLRSSREPLKGGGSASGPVSFMRGFDAFAGVIKSGGKTRRAAKMVILNCDHPDIRQFIACKAHEEKKAHALIDAGYDGSFNGEAYNSVMFQNSNNSVRVTDEFMNAVCEGAQYPLKGRDGSVIETVNAQDIWREIADAAWQCGDPGVQFDTVCNEWHTVPVSGRINASNPCAEYMHLDDSACNLASLNLRKFTLPGWFDIRSFTEAVDLTILAQEIIVGFSSYPTPRIWDNSHRFRPLGLGYANLGAMLMSWGIPYDSHEGRSFASSITALMTGAAYRMSAEIARACGPCVGFAENREPFLAVIQKHHQACDELDTAHGRSEIKRAALHQWDMAHTIGLAHGFRNSQATVLAPTGTIGFMMDCDTTGVEPDIALVKYKRLVGGGMLKITNQTVAEALRVLDYSDEQQKKIVEFIENNDTIEGSLVAPEHLPVFDCAFRAEKGTRSIQPIGHIRMMAAVQPFLSGAISKTVNMPSDATVEDITKIYMLAWKLRLKAVAIYRDGCKRIQPLSTSSGAAPMTPVMPPVGAVVEAQPAPARRKLPDERQSITHKFVIGNHEGYIHVGLYPDGAPGELFITMSKEGSTISGLMDSFATAVSLCLQYGVPVRSIVDKFSRTRFEPSGWSGHESIGHASSVLDYIARWLEMKFMTEGSLAARPSQDVGQVHLDVITTAEQAREAATLLKQRYTSAVTDNDAPLCHECGTVMVRSGACHKCSNCGATSGCS